MTYMRLVEQALENPDSASAEKIVPKIVVIGCGGGGCNSINRLNSLGLSGVETVAMNTDRNHLAGIKADRKILVGEYITKGFGTGGDPGIGYRCARASIDSIREVLDGADLTFITAGMGGGSGTGIAPVVADAAKNAGSLSVALVTTPFSYERGREDVAKRGVEALGHTANCTIVLDNNKLIDIAPKLPIDKAFGVMDQIIADTVKSISEMLFETSMINLDFSDFHNVMDDGGLGTIMFGESEDVDDLVDEALANPFLEADLKMANGALIQITGGADMSLKEAYEVFQGITDGLPYARKIKFGARIQEQDHGKMKRVMGIVTGIANRLPGMSPEIPPNILTRRPQRPLAYA